MLEAMKLLRGPRPAATAQVLVAVMSPARMEWYLQMAQQLRAGGLNAEVYWGTGGVGKQVKYADKLGIPYVLIAGDDEFARGKVQIKDLAAGRVAAQKIATNEEWRKSQPAQREVDASAAVAKLLAMVKAGE
jgi:histidyl-tRNA synthetase